MNLRELIKKDFNIDFPISGSTANSRNNPIVIHRQAPNNPTSVEFGIIRCVGIARGVEWEVIEQRLIDHDGKYLDQITIETKEATGTEIIAQLESYYFDITECVDFDHTGNDNADGDV